MSKRLSYLISIPYFLSALIVIFSRLFKYPELENFFRPALLLLLIVWYSIGSSIHKTKFNWIFLAALIFSLMSDILRMPLINNFIIGLTIFLIAHLLLSFSFFWECKGKVLKSLIDSWLFLTIMFLIVSSIFVSLLPPLIKNSQSVFLVAMPALIIFLYILIMSTNLYSNVNDTIYGRYVLLAGFFFLFSDSILAFNRFSIDVRLSSVWVLSFYVLAQWFIVYGFMYSKKIPDQD